MALKTVNKTPFWSTSVRPQYAAALIAAGALAVGFVLGAHLG